jgi:glutamate-1-semialdehyde aminotransferase
MSPFPMPSGLFLTVVTIYIHFKATSNQDITALKNKPRKLRHGLTPVVDFLVVTYSYHSCESFVSIFLTKDYKELASPWSIRS